MKSGRYAYAELIRITTLFISSHKYVDFLFIPKSYGVVSCVHAYPLAFRSRWGISTMGVVVVSVDFYLEMSGMG